MFTCGPALITGQAIIGDPYYANRSLGLHFDGSNESITFTDNSPSPKTPTVNGNAQISTAQSKFGGASGLFDGVGDFLSYSSNADYDFGSGDFVFSTWYRPATNTVDCCLAALWNPTTALGTDAAWGIFHYGAALTGRMQCVIYSGNDAYTVAGLSALSVNTWQHIEFGRSSGTLYFAIGGIIQGTRSAAVGINAPGSRSLRIASLCAGLPYEMNGYLDDLLIYKGIGPHTSNFTPPAGPFSDS